MKSLYVKVVRGYYPSIPSRYSADLEDVISMCLQTSPIKRATAEVLMKSRQLQKIMESGSDSSEKTQAETPKTSLLNTIKLPKKLLDITKRLPKANYCSPIIINKKKVMDIKIAKGLPEIFDKPKSRITSERSQQRQASEASDRSIKLLRNRLYHKVLQKNSNNSPKIDYSHKIRLPKIQRVGTNPAHNYSVNYSCRSLGRKRDVI